VNDLGQREDHRPKTVRIEPEAADDHCRAEIGRDEALLTETVREQHEVSGVDDLRRLSVVLDPQRPRRGHDHMRLVSFQLETLFGHEGARKNSVPGQTNLRQHMGQQVA